MASIPETLRCTTCSKEFSNDEDLTKHLSSPRRCPCSDCSFAKSSCFTTDEDLYRHMQQYHRHMICTFCKKTFNTPAAKQRHDMTGSLLFPESPLKDFCLWQAMEADHEERSQRAKTLCDDCCTNYDSHEEFSRHECHPQDRRKDTPLYECGICGLRDLTEYGLGAHRYWNHNESHHYNNETHFNGFGKRKQPKAKAPPKTPPEASAKPPPKASPKPAPQPPIKPKPSSAAMDLYVLLGVRPRSSPQAIERAVKKKRIECHPDKLKRNGMSDPELQAIDDWAKEVGGAAEVLLDPSKRAQYDKQRRNGLKASKAQ